MAINPLSAAPLEFPAYDVCSGIGEHQFSFSFSTARKKFMRNFLQKLCGEKSKKNASIAKDPVAARHLFPVCHRTTVRSIETKI